MSETEKFSKGQAVQFTYGDKSLTGIVYGPSGKKCINIRVGDDIYRVLRDKAVKA